MKAFFDSNILVYAQTDSEKGQKARSLLASGGMTSVQVLNEFANVMRKKLGMDWPEIRLAIADITVLFPEIVSLSLAMHHEALGISERHGLSFYDALIVAAAAESGCDFIWTEDMQHDARIAGVLLRNPFY